MRGARTVSSPFRIVSQALYSRGMDLLWQFFSQNAEPIQALCAVLTVIIALVAAVVALRQLAAGYRIHHEQAQPYVAVGMRSLDQIDSHFIEFFVRNFGHTAAFDVHVSSDPPLQQVWQGEEAEPMWLFEVLPTLVPGDEWTQMLGFAPSHFEGRLPMKYNVTVRWKDSRGESFSAKYVLDWDAHRNRNSVCQRTVHHLAGTMRDINGNLRDIRKAVEQIRAR